MEKLALVKNETSLSPSDIQAVARTSPTAEGVLLACAVRERNTPNTDLRRCRNDLVKHGIQVVEKDYMNTWKELERKGVGSIVYGRGGKPDRFMWNYSLINVGKMAFEPNTLAQRRKAVEEAKTAPITHKKRGRKPGSKNKPKPQQQGPVQEKMLYLPLGQGRKIQMSFPADLSSCELNNLSEAIKNLLL